MQAILPTNFPAYQFKLRNKGDAREVFDPVRKKYVSLTPEEFVRQHVIAYLQQELDYPISLLSVEKGMMLNGLQKRCDIVAYNRNGAPKLIIECKAPEVKINQAALNQAARYNLHFKVPYLLVCNGLTFCSCQINEKTGDIQYLHGFPHFSQL